MTFATWYNVGTVSVEAGSAAVVGSGTFWAGNIAAGDYLWVGGLSCRILSIESSTALTLARPWPGANASGAYYEAMVVLDAVGYQRETGELLTKLSSGNLDTLAGLVGAADRLPYFTGPGTLGLTTVTSFGRSLLDDLDALAFWTTIGATAAADKAFRRGNVLGTVSQSGGNPTGALIERGSNANGEYVRFPDGMQICVRTGLASNQAISGVGNVFQANSQAWNFPAAFLNAATTTSWATVNNAASWVNVTTSNSLLANFTRLCAVSDPSARTVDLVAIGRWF